MRKTPVKKRGSLRPRSNVDPTRAALAALDRVKTVLVMSGHEKRLGPPLGTRELAAQADAFGCELPPSYVAAMRVASKIGEPENLLEAHEMAEEAAQIVAFGGEEAKRYVPFCRTPDAVICFDKGVGPRPMTSAQHEGELPIVEWRDGFSNPIAAHFGEWLDLVADAREESVENAAQMPPRLKRLLYELGFRFEYPVVGRVETGDIAAIEELLGAELATSVRGDVDRLFDTSGKAPLALNVDDFKLTVVLRTGTFVFEAEDVFRWLRSFRDENFWNESVREPSHPDIVRDLRRAPREPPIAHRGISYVPLLPAQRHVFRAASGTSASDFYLLGRPASGARGPSMILHVVEGVVATHHAVDEPLDDLYVARDGTMWGLTTTHAVRFSGGRVQAYPLHRPSQDRAVWHGIGGGGDRVLVWGAGALLEFDGSRFVPFEPDAMLDDAESVVALSAHGLRIAMLVVSDRMGAVARFDATRWLPITEDQVIEASLRDLDWWRGAAYVLDGDGRVWIVDASPPAEVPIPSGHPALTASENGAPRRIHGVRVSEGGIFLASDGGVVVLPPAGDPIFHAVSGGRDPFRLVRVAPQTSPELERTAEREVGVVALSGPHVWVWKPGAGHEPGHKPGHKPGHDPARHEPSHREPSHHEPGLHGGFDAIDMREW